MAIVVSNSLFNLLGNEKIINFCLRGIDCINATNSATFQCYGGFSIGYSLNHGIFGAEIPFGFFRIYGAEKSKSFLESQSGCRSRTYCFQCGFFLKKLLKKRDKHDKYHNKGYKHLLFLHGK